MITKNVKTNLLEHSQAKVNLLNEYINRYLSIICNDGYTEDIFIYDLFCGEGVYDDGGKGSPLVFTKAIKDVYYINKARNKSIPKIHAHFNDLDSAKVEKVEKAIKEFNLHYPEFGSLKFSSIDYKICLQKLTARLNNLKNQKAFIFIDPYEYKHIKISHIKQLMQNGKTEVLLWLPTQFMYRFEKNGTPTALKDFIEELVPYEKWKYSKNSISFVEELKNGFQNAMGNDYFVDKFSIQKDPQTVFSLFFFTTHIKGFEKMLESKWKIDSEQGKGWSFDKQGPSLFHQQKTNPLNDKLSEYLSKEARTNGEIYEFTLRNSFLPKHSTEIFNAWQEKGKIDVRKSDGTKARKKAFYISYKNYKEEFSKVFIKRI